MDIYHHGILKELTSPASYCPLKLDQIIRALKKQPLILDKWDDTIWTVLVEKGIVHKNGHITFVFYNGTEIEVGAK